MGVEELVYKGFISKKELVGGRVYVYKDGRLALFVGYDEYGRFIFYELGHVLFVPAGSGVGFAHGEVQVEYLSCMCRDIMSRGVNLGSLFGYKSFPQLYGEFPWVSWEGRLEGWWRANKQYLGSRIPTIPTLEGTGEVKSLFIGARELVPGELYYTGDSHRATYLYLGRDSMGMFCWWFVGNASILLNYGIRAVRMYGGIERTKSNKKCKLFRNIGLDKGALLYGDYRRLVGKSFSVDGLNLG